MPEIIELNNFVWCIMLHLNFDNQAIQLKEPCSFFQLFENFLRYHMAAHIFLIIHGKFNSEKCSISKKLMKTWLVTIIKLKTLNHSKI